MHYLSRRWLSNWAVFATGLLLLPLLGCQEKVAPAPQGTTVTPPASPNAPGAPATTSSEAKPATASEAPPEATIKAMLEKDMWGPPEQGGTKHTYNYKSLKIAAPRKGNYLTDGVPANTETMVHPVKVVVEVVRTFTDGTSKQEEKNQSYVFFKDEFGDWTYRFIQNN